MTLSMVKDDAKGENEKVVMPYNDIKNNKDCLFGYTRNDMQIVAKEATAETLSDYCRMELMTRHYNTERVDNGDLAFQTYSGDDLFKDDEWVLTYDPNRTGEQDPIYGTQMSMCRPFGYTDEFIESLGEDKEYKLNERGMKMLDKFIEEHGEPNFAYFDKTSDYSTFKEYVNANKNMEIRYILGWQFKDYSMYAEITESAPEKDDDGNLARDGYMTLEKLALTPNNEENLKYVAEFMGGTNFSNNIDKFIDNESGSEEKNPSKTGNDYGDYFNLLYKPLEFKNKTNDSMDQGEDPISGKIKDIKVCQQMKFLQYLILTEDNEIYAYVHYMSGGSSSSYRLIDLGKDTQINSLKNSVMDSDISEFKDQRILIADGKHTFGKKVHVDNEKSSVGDLSKDDIAALNKLLPNEWAKTLLKEQPQLGLDKIVYAEPYNNIIIGIDKDKNIKYCTSRNVTNEQNWNTCTVDGDVEEAYFSDRGHLEVKTGDGYFNGKSSLQEDSVLNHIKDKIIGYRGRKHILLNDGKVYYNQSDDYQY